MPKGICPECGNPAPKGMRCRECLCDILGGYEIGFTKALTKQIAKERRAEKKRIDKENTLILFTLLGGLNG